MQRLVGAFAVPRRLKVLRVERDLTQRDVAKFLGVSPTTYNWIEQRRRPCNDDERKKLAKYFRVDESEIFNIQELGATA